MNVIKAACDACPPRLAPRFRKNPAYWCIVLRPAAKRAKNRSGANAKSALNNGEKREIRGANNRSKAKC